MLFLIFWKPIWLLFNILQIRLSNIVSYELIYWADNYIHLNIFQYALHASKRMHSSTMSLLDEDSVHFEKCGTFISYNFTGCYNSLFFRNISDQVKLGWMMKFFHKFIWQIKNIWNFILGETHVIVFKSLIFTVLNIIKNCISPFCYQIYFKLIY